MKLRQNSCRTNDRKHNEVDQQLIPDSASSAGSMTAEERKKCNMLKCVWSSQSICHVS